MLPPTRFYYFVVESRACNIFFCSLPLNLKQKRQRRRKDKKQKRVSFYPILSRLQTNWSQNNEVAAQHGIVWHKLYMNTDETNTRYIQILQNDEKCEKTVVLGTSAKNQLTPENVDASPTYGFVGNFPLPQNPTGNSIFGSYLPVPSKVLAFENLPLPLLISSYPPWSENGYLLDPSTHWFLMFYYSVWYTIIRVPVNFAGKALIWDTSLP